MCHSSGLGSNVVEALPEKKQQQTLKFFLFATSPDRILTHRKFPQSRFTSSIQSGPATLQQRLYGRRAIVYNIHSSKRNYILHIVMLSLVPANRVTSSAKCAYVD